MRHPRKRDEQTTRTTNIYRNKNVTEMKNPATLALSLCAVALFAASCKSQESAYRQAYERARAQEMNKPTQTVTIIPQNTQPQPVQPAPVQQPAAPVVQRTVVVEEDNTPVRTIQGEKRVIDGEPLKAFSVVVGSFVNETNARGMMNTLRNRGYAARVMKTNETINGHTGWYRVVASSFSSKSQAVQSKNSLRDTYPGAWILGN